MKPAARAIICGFSEVYYKDWKAYRWQTADYVKRNYVLRAMVVPAGKHTVEFRFEPAIFFTSKRISFISSWLLALLFIGIPGASISPGRQKENTKA